MGVKARRLLIFAPLAGVIALAALPAACSRGGGDAALGPTPTGAEAIEKVPSESAGATTAGGTYTDGGTGIYTDGGTYTGGGTYTDGGTGIYTDGGTYTGGGTYTDGGTGIYTDAVSYAETGTYTDSSYYAETSTYPDSSYDSSPGSQDASQPYDAGSSYCGDRRCSSQENCLTCAKDCGRCFCGDGRCTKGESCKTCPTDCGRCRRIRLVQ